MAISLPALSDIDLSDKDVYQRGVPHEWFTRLRREAPVAWHELPDVEDAGFWAVTRYDDVVTVNRDNALFSSHEGAVFIWDLPPDQLEQQRMMMLNMDPPLHTRYRRIVNRGFTPRMVQELGDTLRKRTTAIVDQVAERGECDRYEHERRELEPAGRREHPGA